MPPPLHQNDVINSWHGARYPKENARIRDMCKSDLSDPEGFFQTFLEDFMPSDDLFKV